MSRRYTHKNRLDTPQRHINTLRSYKSSHWIPLSGFFKNPRTKSTWVNYSKDYRGYSHKILKERDKYDNYCSF